MAKKTNSDLYVDNDMWNDLCSIQGYNAIEMLADIIKESTEHGEKVWIELDVVKRWLKNDSK